MVETEAKRSSLVVPRVVFFYHTGFGIKFKDFIRTLQERFKKKRQRKKKKKDPADII